MVRGPLGAPKARGPLGVALTPTTVRYATGYGTDFFSVFLKVGIEVLAPSLAQLLNLSLSTGRFPDSWKIARVAPIHKKGPKDDRSNYRPISVLRYEVRGTRTCHFFRGTFLKPLRNYGYHFHNFLTFHGIMGVPFRGFFIISGIMAQIFIRFVELWP